MSETNETKFYWKNVNLETIKILVQTKSDLNKKDINGYTALSWASINGYTEIVKELIEAKADLNSKDSLGYTALISASINGNTEIVKLLIEAKADLNKMNDYGHTALICASRYGRKEIIKLLEEASKEVPTKVETEVEINEFETLKETLLRLEQKVDKLVSEKE